MKLFGISFGTLNAQLAAAFTAIGGLIALGTMVYHLMEGWSRISSFYFTVCTITTVGYGDLVPSSEAPSWLITALFALAGVSLLALVILRDNRGNYLRGSEAMILRSRNRYE